MTNLLGSIRLAGYAFSLIAALVAVPFFCRQVRARCFNWVRTAFGGLFLFYVLCVLALVFFPLPDAAQAAKLSTYRIQLVPFQFVADFLRETPLVLSDVRTYLPALLDRTVLQVVCNILMLMPFGMYLRYVCGLDVGRVALASLAFSAFIELGQLTGLFFVFRGSYRLCDVDDLMLNTLGGLLGGELVRALEAYLPPLDAFDRFPGSSALAMQPAQKDFPVPTPPHRSRPIFCAFMESHCATYRFASASSGVKSKSFSKVSGVCSNNVSFILRKFDVQKLAHLHKPLHLHQSQEHAVHFSLTHLNIWYVVSTPSKHVQPESSSFFPDPPAHGSHLLL